ncbi:MAG: right-handed parallel beta-helix repeat-containing protein, partial [Candidatus Micrarchaeia archaeon]
MGRERALYILASILLFSAIFAADGPECGVSGCTQMAGSFSPNGISIAGSGGDFATVSTANGGSMKIENGALERLQGGERVRLLVKKKKAPAGISITNTTVETNTTGMNATVETNTNVEINTTAETNATDANINATVELNATLETNATLDANATDANINTTLDINTTLEANTTETFTNATVELNATLPGGNSPNGTPGISLPPGDSSSAAGPASLPGKPSSSPAQESQPIKPAGRGLIGEIILFYQKIMLMMAPPPESAGDGQPPGQIQPIGGAGLPQPEGLPQQPAAPSSQVDVIAEFPGGNVVVETGIGGLAALADAGADEVYLDYEVGASLPETLPMIGALASQAELNFTGSGVTVCLLDTGVDFAEPALGGMAASGYDFVNSDADASDDSFSGHGTKMAAIIHAVAPGASILAVKVLDGNGTGYASSVVAGIDYCREQAQNGSNVRIISMSLGGGSYGGYCNSDPVADEANLAFSEGMLVTAASGNSGGALIAAPACAENATAVAAATKQDTIPAFSSINGAVDLLAPGEGVVVLGASNSGTSISTAHVSGSAALLYQAEPSLAPAEAEARFKATGKLIGHNGANYSRIDVYAALLNISGGAPTNQTVNNTNITQNATYGALETNVTCGNALSAAGTTYALNASCSISGATAFNVSAQNITLDCQGWSITGNNTTATYGIYSNQFNTTIRNCNISNFGTGIYLYRANNGTISDTNASSVLQAVTGSYGYGIFLNNTNLSVISGVVATAPSGYGIYLLSSSNNTLANLTATSTSGRALFLYSTSNYNVAYNVAASANYAIRLETGSSYNVFSNITATTVGGNAIYLTDSANYNNFSNLNATSTGSYSSAITLQASVYYNIFSNLSATSTGSSSYAFTLVNTANSNTITNINATALLGIAVRVITSSSNTIANNSFVGGAGIYYSATAISHCANTITNNTGAGGKPVLYYANAGVSLSDIDASEIILCNSNGSSISNANVTSGGVQMFFSNYNTLSGIAANASSAGASTVYLQSSASNTLSNINATATDGYAAWFASSHNNSVSSLNATATTGYGVYLTSSSSNNTFSGFTAASTISYALYSASGSNNAFSNFNATVTTANAVYLNAGANNNLSNFRVAATSNYAVFFSSSSNNTVSNLSATVTSSYGIYLSSSHYNRISNLNITATTGNGIQCLSSSNNTFSNVNTTATGSNGNGVYFDTCSNSTFSGVNATATTGAAVYITGGSGNAFSTLNATATTGRAIYLISSYFNRFTNATATATTGRVINLQSASNNTFFNVNSTSTSTGRAIYSTGASDNTFSNMNVAAQTFAIWFATSCINNTFANITSSGGTYGVFLATGVNYNTFSNLAASTTAGTAIYVSDSSSNIFSNTTATATAAGGRAIGISGGSNNTVANSTAATNTSVALTIETASNSNTIVNTTLISTNQSGILLNISPDSSGNTFYWNNFTATSGYYAADLNGSNYYNATTPIGQNEGNIWYNVANGSVNITGLAFSSLSGLFIGNAGTGYPYNNTTAGGKLLGNVADWAPLTDQGPPQCAAISTPGQIYTLQTNISASGATCFNITAENVTLDCAGFGISGTNSSGTFGVYSNQDNTTIRNCNISNFSTGIYFAAANNSTIDNVNASTTRSESGVNGYAIKLASVSRYNA